MWYPTVDVFRSKLLSAQAEIAHCYIGDSNTKSLLDMPCNPHCTLPLQKDMIRDSPNITSAKDLQRSNEVVVAK